MHIKHIIPPNKQKKKEKDIYKHIHNYANVVLSFLIHHIINRLVAQQNSSSKNSNT